MEVGLRDRFFIQGISDLILYLFSTGQERHGSHRTAHVVHCSVFVYSLP
jgi:hypothetical protein